MKKLCQLGVTSQIRILGGLHKMSLIRLQPSNVSLKKLRLLSLPDKTCEILSLLARISLLLCLVSSISLVVYTTFFSNNQAHSWLRYPNPTRTIAEPESDHQPTGISHILFCIGGSAATWHDRSSYNSLWWVPNVTRGFVWLDKKPKNRVTSKSVAPLMVSSPEWTRFKYSSSRSAVRMARIIKDSFKLRLRDVRWFVMGDDDTVFYTDNLVSVLSKYDHNQMWYIGGNSESVEQDEMHSYDMAFGGGGFAVSYPLAENLVNRLDGCLDRYYYFYGSDQRIWACISEIGVPVTKERGFHQFDIRGSAYGLLAAHPLAPVVSLHHLVGLDPLFPNQTQIESLKSIDQAYQVDPPRIFQQTFFHDHRRKWSISIAWGYTIQIYPSLLTANELQTPLRTFKTWRSSSDGPFTFNTRPMKPDPCNQPIVFMLERAEQAGMNGSLTIYKRVSEKPEKTCNTASHALAMSVQRIAISSLKIGPDYWKRAPRRYCCELMNSGRIKSSSMRIRIRKCRNLEAVTT